MRIIGKGVTMKTVLSSLEERQNTIIVIIIGGNISPSQITGTVCCDGEKTIVPFTAEYGLNCELQFSHGSVRELPMCLPISNAFYPGGDEPQKGLHLPADSEFQVLLLLVNLLGQRIPKCLARWFKGLGAGCKVPCAAPFALMHRCALHPSCMRPVSNPF